MAVAVVCTVFFIVVLLAFVVVVFVAVGFARVVDDCVVVWVVVEDSTFVELERVVVRCVVLVVCGVGVVVGCFVVVVVLADSACVFSFSAMPLQAVSSSAAAAITNALRIVSPPTRSIPQLSGNIQTFRKSSAQVTV